jgi:putative peptidoglycan lipid II flippase
MLKNRVGSLGEHKIGSVSLSFVAAGLLSGGAGIAVISLLGGVAKGSFVVDTILSSLLTMLIAGFAMAATYAVALRLLRVSEIDTVISGLRGILRR